MHSGVCAGVSLLLHVLQRSGGAGGGVAETAQARSEEILLVGAADFW